MTNQDIIRRLAYIKYLYKVGIEQSKQSDTISYVAVLSFHDSIDWFMNLACLKLGITEKDKKRIAGKQLIALMDYFVVIPTLTLGASVEKINNRRNNLKHHFQIPAQVEVEECKGIATVFFDENTKAIFGCNFSDISIIDLIEHEDIRHLLKNAESFKNESKAENCINEVSKAFFELSQVDINFIRKKQQFKYIDIYSIPYLQIPGLEENKEFQILKAYIDSIINAYNRNFQEINESINIFALGIDYRKYLKLKSFMPTTSMKDKQGVYSVTKARNIETITNEDLDFAIDFILECTLQIQKFKYNA